MEGILKEDSGRVEKPVGRSLKDRKLMAVRADGRSAVTLFKVLKRFEKNTLVEFELKTGRTHQIRVHAAYMGHPVVGDKLTDIKISGLSSTVSCCTRKSWNLRIPIREKK